MLLSFSACGSNDEAANSTVKSTVSENGEQTTAVNDTDQTNTNTEQTTNTTTEIITNALGQTVVAQQNSNKNGSNNTANSGNSNGSNNSNNNNGGSNNNGNSNSNKTTKKSSSNNSNKSSNTAQKSTTKKATSCKHKNTVVKNAKKATTSSAGYTGDTYCKNCGKLISKGKTIAKISTSNKVSHTYPQQEQEMLKMVNAERKKAGVPALTWNEDIYFAAKIRAKEVAEYFRTGGVEAHDYDPHYRIYNGEWDDFWTVFVEYDYLNFSAVSENISECVVDNFNKNGVSLMMNGLMNSSSHKKAILDGQYKTMSIAFADYKDKEGNAGHVVVQLFYTPN